MQMPRRDTVSADLSSLAQQRVFDAMQLSLQLCASEEQKAEVCLSVLGAVMGITGAQWTVWQGIDPETVNKVAIARDLVLQVTRRG